MAALSGCEGDKPAAPAHARVATCTAVDVGSDGAVVLARGVEILPSSETIRWISARDGDVHEIADDPIRPSDLGPAQALGGRVWDAWSWYRVACVDCRDGENPELGIERVNRLTGTTMRLGSGDRGLHEPILFGGYVYWGLDGHDLDDGGVHRVRKRGGPQQSIRIAARRDDHIHGLKPYPGRGLLVIGMTTVAWIPGFEPQGVMLRESHTFIGDAVADGDDVFIAEAGRKYDDRPGYILRVSIATGVVKRLTGPLAQPTQVAVHGDQVYFMLEESPGVWSVPRAGGAITQVVGGPPYDHEIGEESLGLWAGECGLVWLRGNSASPATGTLSYRPW